MCHRPWPTCLTGFGRVPPKKTALPVVQMALSLFAGAIALRFGTRPSLFGSSRLASRTDACGLERTLQRALIAKSLWALIAKGF
jgi:hypothetical protein